LTWRFRKESKKLPGSTLAPLLFRAVCPSARVTSFDRYDRAQEAEHQTVKRRLRHRCAEGATSPGRSFTG